MSRAVPPADIAPEEFFTRWLPSVVAADAERRAQLGDTAAILAFELEGEGGGVFHVHVDCSGVRGAVGEPLRADLRVRLELATWRALNAGTLSAPRAFLQRKVHLSGNLVLAVKLHLILG
ncbi:MAG TPA: SCP2 sterol-binding domain-containing protein [Myxococcota bacterium]|jgi:putative sterol carrier protein